MIAILVLIVSLNAIQCQDFCQLMKTDGKGIHVYNSVVNKTYVMYKNGIQWEFGVVRGVLDMKNNTNRPIDTAIVNRFGGSDYDCNVMNQSNTEQIVTKCTVGGDDTVSQYDRNALIFRTNKTNDWVIIYSKIGPKIWCYSPKERLSDRLVKDTKECKQKMRMKKTEPLFLESMDPLIVDKIDGLVDYIRGRIIDGHYVFMNEKSGPRYCEQSLSDPKCNSVANYTRIRPDCFAGSESQPEKRLHWALITLIVIAGIVGVILIFAFFCFTTGFHKKISKWYTKRKEKAAPGTPPLGDTEAVADPTSQQTTGSPSERRAVPRRAIMPAQTGVKPPEAQQTPGSQQRLTTVPSTPGTSGEQRSADGVRYTATIRPIPETGEQSRYVVTYADNYIFTGGGTYEVDIRLPATDKRIKTLRQLVNDIQNLNRQLHVNNTEILQLRLDLQRAQTPDDKTQLDGANAERKRLVGLLKPLMETLRKLIETLIKETSATRRLLPDTKSVTTVPKTQQMDD